MTHHPSVSHRDKHVQAMQLNRDNIEEMETFVDGDQKGTKLAREYREVEFWDKFSHGGNEVRIRMTDWAVKYSSGFIHVVTDETFKVLYEIHPQHRDSDDSDEFDKGIGRWLSNRD